MIVASEAHEWKDGVCRECGYVCLHNDADKDHICDYCKKTISEHEDKDKNHICDYCKRQSLLMKMRHPKKSKSLTL